MNQLALFEPSASDVAGLALGHLKRAASYAAQEDICRARGWCALAERLGAAARWEQDEAEVLAMLGEFYALGGVQ